MNSITTRQLFDLQRSLSESRWDSTSMYNLSRGSDAPHRISLGDFCMAYKVFPEAKEYLTEKLVETEEVLKRVKDAEDEIDDIIYRKCNKKDEWFWRMIAEEIIINPVKNKALALQKRLSFVLTKRSKQAILNIERARAYPITDLIEFNKAGFAKCIWHNEKTASMKYYPKTNSVYCFSCGAHGDSIKVYRQLTNASFIDAVKKLS